MSDKRNHLEALGETRDGIYHEMYRLSQEIAKLEQQAESISEVMDQLERELYAEENPRNSTRGFARSYSIVE